MLRFSVFCVLHFSIQHSQAYVHAWRPNPSWVTDPSCYPNKDSVSCHPADSGPRMTTHRLVNGNSLYQQQARGRLSSAHQLGSVSEDTTKKGVEDGIVDCAIIGGGPAGLALAIALSKRGLYVKVFEAVSDIKEKGAAVFLQVGMSVFGPVAPINQQNTSHERSLSG